MEEQVDSKRAYRAACELVDIASKRLHSENLMTLSQIMDVEPHGSSADAAIEDEWRKLWGEGVQRDEAATLALISQFIVREGVWDLDDQGPQLVRRAVERYIETNDPNDPVISDWRTAVWRDGNR